MRRGRGGVLYICVYMHMYIHAQRQRSSISTCFSGPLEQKRDIEGRPLEISRCHRFKKMQKVF